MLINISNTDFLIDEDDWFKYQKSKLFIINIRNRKYIGTYNNLNKRIFLSKLILNTNNRVCYKDGNTLNLQKNNLEINSLHRKKIIKQEYYINNINKIKENVKSWSKTNRVKINKTQDKFRKKHNYSCNKKYQYSLKGKFNNLKNSGKNRSKNRILSINISFDQYQELMKNNCYYCQKNLMLETGSSLDRIDNTKNYTIDNVLPCCGNCNKIRGAILTVDEMKHIMVSLIEYRKEKENGKKT